VRSLPFVAHLAELSFSQYFASSFRTLCSAFTLKDPRCLHQISDSLAPPLTSLLFAHHCSETSSELALGVCSSHRRDDFRVRVQQVASRLWATARRRKTCATGTGLREAAGRWAIEPNNAEQIAAFCMRARSQTVSVRGLFENRETAVE
jgi:hypothetical protein